MKTAKRGDKVRVHFTGKLDDGTVFSSSRQNAPVEFTIGSGKLLPEFEAETIGMAVNQHKTVRLVAKRAYGERLPEMVSVVPIANLPDKIDLFVGREIRFSSHSGNSIHVVVTGISETEVTIDANQPLAGQPLTFDIELVAFV